MGDRRPHVRRVYICRRTRHIVVRSGVRLEDVGRIFLINQHETIVMDSVLVAKRGKKQSQHSPGREEPQSHVRDTGVG